MEQSTHVSSAISVGGGSSPVQNYDTAKEVDQRDQQLEGLSAKQ